MVSRYSMGCPPGVWVRAPHRAIMSTTNGIRRNRQRGFSPSGARGGAGDEDDQDDDADEKAEREDHAAHDAEDLSGRRHVAAGVGAARGVDGLLGALAVDPG